MMFNKKSKDAKNEDTLEKGGKKKKNKKDKLTPKEKAIKNKQKVEKKASQQVKRADNKIKKIEQNIKNKEKAAAKKIKDKEKKAANKLKAEEKKLENKEKKREQRTVNKIRKKEQKIEKKAEQQAERMQRKAELAARTPIQKKADRRMKMRKFLAVVLIFLILIGLGFAGVKYGPRLIEKIPLPEINFTQITNNIKEKIPFLNKEQSEEKEDEENKSETEENSQEVEDNQIQDDITLYISGTSVLKEFYTQALGEFLNLSKKELDDHVKIASANESYTDLLNGDNQVIFSKFPTEKETKMAELAGVDLHPIPILNGGFVFFINKDNPIKNLTKTQLYNIYSETITNWDDLGGKNEPIIAYQRTDNSGSQLGMYKYVIDKSEIMKVSDDIKLADTKAIVKEVSSNKGAIGYTYYYYLDKLKNSDDVKLLSVNGVIPNKKNIADAKYPLTTYSYAIIANEEDTQSLSDVINSVNDKIDSMNANSSKDDGKTGVEGTTDAEIEEEPLPLKMQFVEWILSDDGQKLAEENGFIRHNNK